MASYFKLRRKLDTSIPTVGIMLSLFGLVMVLSASQVTSINAYSSPYHYFIAQLISWLLGMLAFFYYLKLPIEKLYEQRSGYFYTTIFLLVIVFIFPRIAGVHRWINLGFFQLQPAEIAKLFLVVYFAGWFASKGDKVASFFRGFLPFIAVLVTVSGLIILEPDMGTMLIVILLSMIIFFVAKANLIHYVGIVLIGIVALVILAYAAPYRAARLESFLGKNNNAQTEQDKLDAAYQNQQALIAIGSGGLWGEGFGQGLSKYSYLPESHTDSIFAVVGEELGFFRTSLIILAYVYLAWRGYVVSLKANSRFSKLLAVGLSAAIISQAMINIGGLLGIIPLTGVPLPFISYGGSSLVVCLAMLGLLTNVSREVE